MMRVLDCGGALVTAVVTESVYNKLRVGAAATFIPEGGSGALSARVAGLTGVSAAPANFAILPSLLIRESYHVTLNVPALAEEGACTVGRTGRVIFGDASTADGAELRL